MTKTQELFENWRALVLNLNPLNVAEIRPVINKLYSTINYAEPEFIVANSPAEFHRLAATIVQRKEGSKSYFLKTLFIGLGYNDSESFCKNVNEEYDIGRLGESVFDQANRRLRFLKKYLFFGNTEPELYFNYDYGVNILKKKLSRPASGKDGLEGKITPLIINANRMCRWWLPCEDKILLLNNPQEIHLDNNEFLHKADGPALVWRDNTVSYFFHGTPVEKKHIDKDFTPDDIDNERNLEIRRAMMEIYDVKNYIIDSKAAVIHTDEWGTLYRKTLPLGGEPFVLVKVVNSTAEPDGTFKDYYLRVPPNMTTAREAIAWTFGKDSDEYKPEQET